MITTPVMFHHFTDDVHPAGQGALDAVQLRAVLDRVGVERILRADEYLERVRADRLDPDSVCLTFDDNLRCQYDVALPVLRELGLTAFWFVYSSPLEGTLERLELYRYFRTVAFDSVESFYREFFARAVESPGGDAVERELASFDPASWRPETTFYTDDDRRFRHLRDGVLSDGGYDLVMESMMREHDIDTEQLAGHLWMDEACWTELRDLGHEIGLHSHTHPTSMAQLPLDVQRREYAANAECIQRATGIRPTTAAHPCGSYTLQTLDILEELGVELAFAVNGGVRHRPHLEIQRVDSTDALAAAGG
jgi:peptidoglycan/xylan/chitin deacetylase (PgdA/CDA1 family)